MIVTSSPPLAADAYLLAARHAEAVITFAHQTGATLYQRQAEQLLRAIA